MYNTFIGIDVGKMGAMCVLTPNRMLLYPTKNKTGDYDIWKMHMELKEHASAKSCAVIERAQAMPKQGVVSMFEFGRGYGIWLALLNVNYISYQVVHARVWTKALLVGAPGEGKERSFQVASRMHPKWRPQYEYERQYADAILLAEYARRVYEGS